MAFSSDVSNDIIELWTHIMEKYVWFDINEAKLVVSVDINFSGKF